MYNHFILSRYIVCDRFFNELEEQADCLLYFQNQLFIIACMSLQTKLTLQVNAMFLERQGNNQKIKFYLGAFQVFEPFRPNNFDLIDKITFKLAVSIFHRFFKACRNLYHASYIILLIRFRKKYDKNGWEVPTRSKLVRKKRS